MVRKLLCANQVSAWIVGRGTDCGRGYSDLDSASRERASLGVRLLNRIEHDLEDRNLLKLRSLDSSFPFFLSDNSIWRQ